MQKSIRLRNIPFAMAIGIPTILLGTLNTARFKKVQMKKWNAFMDFLEKTKKEDKINEVHRRACCGRCPRGCEGCHNEKA
jgi:hypothetical protein